MMVTGRGPSGAAGSTSGTLMAWSTTEMLTIVKD